MVAGDKVVNVMVFVFEDARIEEPPDVAVAI
jgi:hypothetical protein